MLVDVADLEERPDVALFNETAGTFVVEVDSPETALALFSEVPCVILGRTIPERELRLYRANAELLRAPVAELQAAWAAPMRGVFH